MDKSAPATIDKYINSIPEESHKLVKEIRAIVKELVPEGEEAISYGILTIKLNGKFVVYFSGYTSHVSIHPASDPMEKEIPEISKYRTGKGTLQFKLDQPLPLPLIRKIVNFLLEQNKARTGKY